MATITCDQCSFVNESGAKFCNQCGAALKLQCPSCGTDNAPGSSFCKECGADLGRSQTVEQVSPDEATEPVGKKVCPACRTINEASST
ncbi:MAG: zinc ribbon domain-containing protein, partial [Dehalococcoidia bacterium]